MNPKIVLQNASGDISSVEFDAAEMTFEFIYKTARYTEEKTVQVTNGYSETVALRMKEFNNLLNADFEVSALIGDIDFLQHLTPLERLSFVEDASKKSAIGRDDVDVQRINSMSITLTVALLSTVNPADWVIPELRVTFNEGQTCPVW